MVCVIIDDNSRGNNDCLIGHALHRGLLFVNFLPPGDEEETAIHSRDDSCEDFRQGICTAWPGHHEYSEEECRGD